MRKNVASQVVGAQMVSASDGSAFTGSVTCHVTGDGGTQAVGSVGSGACTHEGNGFHTYTPSQAETNFNHVAFTFVGTGAVPTTVQIYTRPTTGLLAPTTADRTVDVTATGGVNLEEVLGTALDDTPAGATYGSTIADNLSKTFGDPNFDADIVPISTVAGATLLGQVSVNVNDIETNTNTILARLGSWAGSGLNNLLGAFRALFRKDGDAAVPSDINTNLGGGAGAANNTTDSQEAIRDNMGTPQTGDVFPLASTEIADIKTKTDQLTFTGGNVHANVQAGEIEGTLTPEALAAVAQAVADHVDFQELLSLVQAMGLVSVSGAVSDTTPAAGNFDVAGTDLSANSNWYDDQVLVFVEGALRARSQKISTYNGGPPKNVLFDDPFPAAPANGDEFLILGLIK
jgi:hypothetical protein